MESERRSPRVRRFQAKVRVGRSIRYLGTFSAEDERDQRVAAAKEERRLTGGVVARSEYVDKEIDDPWIAPTRHYTPEQRLCTAMLVQTARDLESDIERERRTARAWVLSDATDFGSFRFCCDTIDRDIQETRRRMLRITEYQRARADRQAGGEGGWQREPSRPMRSVRKDTAQS